MSGAQQSKPRDKRALAAAAAASLAAHVALLAWVGPVLHSQARLGAVEEKIPVELSDQRTPRTPQPTPAERPAQAKMAPAARRLTEDAQPAPAQGGAEGRLANSAPAPEPALPAGPVAVASRRQVGLAAEVEASANGAQLIGAYAPAGERGSRALVAEGGKAIAASAPGLAAGGRPGRGGAPAAEREGSGAQAPTPIADRAAAPSAPAAAPAPPALPASAASLAAAAPEGKKQLGLSPEPTPEGPTVGLAERAEPTAGPSRPASGSALRPLRYPQRARLRGAEGTVKLEVRVGKDGALAGVRVLKSSGDAELDRAAQEWVRRDWRFSSAVKNGQPAEGRVNINVQFRLDEREKGR